MGGIRETYRFDFSSSGNTTNFRVPDASYRWDVKNGWVRRVPVNAPLQTMDIDVLNLQIDKASTDIGANAAVVGRIAILGAAIDTLTTSTFGGKFDTGSSNSYFGVYASSTVASGRRSVAVSNPPQSVRFAYNNNSTLASYCTLFVSFRRSYE